MRTSSPKKVTWKTDDSTLRRNLVAKLGTRLTTTVTSGDIQSIHLRIGAKHTYAANTFVEVVRKMFNWACVASLLPQNFGNPTKGIVFFPRRKRKRYITRAEMPRFLQAIEYEDNEHARHAVWLLLTLQGMPASKYPRPPTRLLGATGQRPGRKTETATHHARRLTGESSDQGNRASASASNAALAAFVSGSNGACRRPPFTTSRASRTRRDQERAGLGRNSLTPC